MTDKFRSVMALGEAWTRKVPIEMQAYTGGLEMRVRSDDGISITLALSDEQADRLGRILVYWAGIDSPVFRLIEADEKDATK